MGTLFKADLYVIGLLCRRMRNLAIEQGELQDKFHVLPHQFDTNVIEIASHRAQTVFYHRLWSKNIYAVSSLVSVIYRDASGHVSFQEHALREFCSIMRGWDLSKRSHQQ